MYVCVIVCLLLTMYYTIMCVYATACGYQQPVCVILHRYVYTITLCMYVSLLVTMCMYYYTLYVCAWLCVNSMYVYVLYYISVFAAALTSVLRKG